MDQNENVSGESLQAESVDISVPFFSPNIPANKRGNLSVDGINLGDFLKKNLDAYIDSSVIKGTKSYKCRSKKRETN